MELLNSLTSTITGGALGGLLRLAPEAFKLWDRKNERTHELSMQDKALEFEKLRGASRMEEIKEQGTQDYNSASLEALQTAIAMQGRNTGKDANFMDKLNQSVRPVTTYLFLGIYMTIKLTTGVALFFVKDVALLDVLNVVWTSADQAMLAGVINFWFLNRVFDKAVGR